MSDPCCRRPRPRSAATAVSGLVAAVALSSLLSACRPASAPAAFFFQSVPTSGWKPEEVVEFTPDDLPQGDSIPFAKASLGEPRLWIRYNLTAPENLPLVMVCERLDSDAGVCDTLRLTLFRDGQPAGEGQRGLYEINTPVPARLIPMVPVPPDSIRVAEGWRLTVYPTAQARGISEIGISF